MLRLFKREIRTGFIRRTRVRVKIENRGEPGSGKELECRGKPGLGLGVRGEIRTRLCVKCEWRTVGC